ncbi:phosphoribosylformylglycinamidine synthase subunit PurL [Desulfobacterota bacterium AH_259_B03_O07]|nr:phosphoribosylformylglycinamidine synthase subunit PurL [Desulfobacterota bacterium AH_259_B03_O07]
MENLQIALNHGLSTQEYNKIVNKLGREPNLTEIGILAAMWSEHCSYKSSKIHLKRLPTKGANVIQGPGENAGIVDIGDELCVIFKMESHNHPSFIEPYQGAATGVGGILRDIFTMGARPIALLNSLRFGDPKLPKTRYLVDGVVSGIAGYGNCIGIPTVGGEVYFDECYNGNPLINVFALGITKKNEIFRGLARGVANPVIYVGSKTGRDGIHGAVMASETFTKEAEEKRPAVQVGDPFTEKLLLESCLELFKTGIVVGIQDMGAAGLTSSSTEMANRAANGIIIDIDKVPRREKEMTPYEIMLSESQERMLIVIKKGNEEIAERIFRKWNLDFSVIGEVTESSDLRIIENSDIMADLPISLITEEAPIYKRPSKKPAYLNNMKNFDIFSIPFPNNLDSIFLKILSSPTVSSKRWIFEQYDHMVRTNTVIPPGSDASIIRIKDTNKAIAITTNCNSRYCYLDPYTGSAIAVAESARNLACSGAKPLAITDCLNFGNPENPEIMWQFKKSIEGLAQAALVLNTPVVSGNVSFYNETEGVAIFPTPTVAMIGLIEDIRNHLTQWFEKEGDRIVLLGETKEEFGGSEYQKQIQGTVRGKPPQIDLRAESALIHTLLEASQTGILHSAHDLSEGGLATAISESCFTPNGSIGVKIKINDNMKIRNDAILFSESQSRALVSLERKNIPILDKITREYGVKMSNIGVVEGDRLFIENMIDIPINEGYNFWSSGFERILNSYA